MDCVIIETLLPLCKSRDSLASSIFLAFLKILLLDVTTVSADKIG